MYRSLNHVVLKLATNLAIFRHRHQCFPVYKAILKVNPWLTDNTYTQYNTARIVNTILIKLYKATMTSPDRDRARENTLNSTSHVMSLYLLTIKNFVASSTTLSTIKFLILSNILIQWRRKMI